MRTAIPIVVTLALALLFLQECRSGWALKHEFDTVKQDARAAAERGAMWRTVAEAHAAELAEAKRALTRVRDSVRLLLARRPTVDTLWRTPSAGGPAVPVPVVLESEYAALAASCTLLDQRCASLEVRYDSLLFAKDSATAADAVRIDALEDSQRLLERRVARASRRSAIERFLYGAGGFTVGRMSCYAVPP